jgi:signal transduction histidine kinase
MRSLLLVPLPLRGQYWGVLGFLLQHPKNHFDNRYLTLTHELASRIALTIDNGELYRKTQRAVALRDEVVAIVSHDLRNPLSVIAMCADTLLDEPNLTRATAVDLAQTVQRSAEWMNTIIHNLLDVAQLESGSLRLRTKPFALAPVILQTIRLNQPLARAKGLQLTQEIAPDLPNVQIDHERITQALSNLVDNAIKFTAPGGSVTIRAYCSDSAQVGTCTNQADHPPQQHRSHRDKSDCVVVAISDTGRGIAADHLPHIFDRFWQVRYQDRQHGVGLGLAITKGIVEAHHGTIWVESTEGAGSTFFFMLPVSA